MTEKRYILELWKKRGETPLECITRFRKDNPQYEKENMTYVGRLDPMAEGLLLVLAGNTRNKEEYLSLDKTYEFEVLWGFETDTYDILGLVTSVADIPTKNFDTKLPALLKKLLEKKTQTYPPYSSKTVMGKSLHAWAREGRIDEIELPTRNIRIFSLCHDHTRLLSQKQIREEIKNNITSVSGDFRQKEILNRWDESLSDEKQALVSKFAVDVSSGTYVRSLAHEMGKEFGSGAIAYSIKRTRVGEYRKERE